MTKEISPSIELLNAEVLWNLRHPVRNMWESWISLQEDLDEQIENGLSPNFNYQRTWLEFSNILFNANLVSLQLDRYASFMEAAHDIRKVRVNKLQGVDIQGTRVSASESINKLRDELFFQCDENTFSVNGSVYRRTVPFMLTEFVGRLLKLFFDSLGEKPINDLRELIDAASPAGYIRVFMLDYFSETIERLEIENVE